MDGCTAAVCWSVLMRLQSCLLTVLYLHRVSASIHHVLGAVGGRASPVEVQLDGVVHIWKTPAAHRHAAADLQHNWEQQQTRQGKTKSSRGRVGSVDSPECPSFSSVQWPVWTSSNPSRCRGPRESFWVMRWSRLMGEWWSSSKGWHKGNDSPQAYGSDGGEETGKKRGSGQNY